MEEVRSTTWGRKINVKKKDMGKVLKKVRKGGNASGVWVSIPEEKSQRVQRC